MLRVTCEQGEGAPTLRVEGSISGPWVDELDGVVGRARAGAPLVVVELSGVTFVDQRGAALLRRLKGPGVALVGGSGFVRNLLNGDQP